MQPGDAADMNPEAVTAPPLLPTKTDRRNALTLKLVIVATLVLLLQAPLQYVNVLRKERSAYHGITSTMSAADAARVAPAAEGYRMVERALKYSVLVLILVFTAFFCFDLAATLRLHAVHYTLVGAALGLFYLALLALGEFVSAGAAYLGAAAASSLLITLYSTAILRTARRAGVIAVFLGVVHTMIFVVLRVEHFALLAGTAALFAAVAVTMYFTRKLEWSVPDSSPAGALAP